MIKRTYDPDKILYRIFKNGKIIRRQYSMTCDDSGRIYASTREKIKSDLLFYKNLAKSHFCDRVDVLISGKIIQTSKWNFKRETRECLSHCQ